MLDQPVTAFVRQLAQQRRKDRPFYSRQPRPRQQPSDLAEAGHDVLFFTSPPQVCSPPPSNPPPAPTLF